MNQEAIKRESQQLEKNLKNLISAFEEKTECRVEGVKFEREDYSSADDGIENIVLEKVRVKINCQKYNY